MTAPPKSAYRFGPFRLEVRDHRLLREGRAVPLTPKVFSLLRVLVENSGHLVEKDDLLKQVWPDSFVEEGALNRAVSVLRKALDDNAPGQKYIETVPKRGYRFVGPVPRATTKGPLEQRRLPCRSQPRVTRPLAIAAASSRSCSWAASGSAFRGVPTGNPPGRRAARARPPSGHVYGTGRLADRLTGRQTHCLRVGPQSREETDCSGLAGGQPIEIFGAPEINYLRWSPDGKRVALLGARRGTEWHLCRAAAWRQAASDRDGAGVPLVLVAGRLDDRGCRRPGQQDPILRRARAGAAGVDPGGRSLVDLGSRLVGRGDKLLFVSSDRQGRYEIGTIRADGIGQQKILSSATEIPSTRWVPDANAIYYLQRINQTMSLFRIPADASTVAPTSGNAVLTGLETDRFFGFSGDARRLVYARARTTRISGCSTSRTVARRS